MTLTTTFDGTRDQLDAWVASMNATLVAAGETQPNHWTCLIMSTPAQPPEEVTLTHVRGDHFVTALLRRAAGGWEVAEAVDEEGNPALLTPKEHETLLLRAERGEDETGR